MQSLIELSDRTRTLKRNELLKSAGSTDRCAYYVESGSLQVFIIDGGEERTVRFGYTGNLITALDSFMNGRPSDLMIRAVKKTTVKIIAKKSIDAFLEQEENKGMWISVLEDLAVQQLEREIDLHTRSPKARYLRVRARSPRLFQEIPNKYIANYLRMTPETLSRLKKS